MNCPLCNREMRIDTEQVGVDDNNIPIFHRFAYCDECKRKKDIDIPQDTKHEEQAHEEQAHDPIPAAGNMQRDLAQKELNLIKSGSGTKAYLILSIMAFVATIFLLYCKEGLLAFACLIGCIVSLVLYVIKEDRAVQLSRIANGQRIVNVCPKCKSDNIEMVMVQKGSVTTHGKSRVSKNINPLRPLTHTNIKMGTEYSSAIYGNQCHCLNCGHIFARPEVHYI